MNPVEPGISIVIVTHNSKSCVTRLLDSVANVAPWCDVVIVDNASTDGTPELIARHYPNVHLVQLAKNLGFGRANNLGVSRAKHEHVLLLNPDTVVLAVAKDALWAIMAEDCLGIVAPLVAVSEQESVFNIRPRLSLAHDWFNTTWRTLIPREMSTRRLGGRSSRGVWVGGSAVLLRRSEFELAGGFPPDVFLYYEDQILSNRYMLNGYPVRNTRAITVVHEPGTGSAQTDISTSVRRVSALLGWLTMVEEIHGSRVAAVWASRSQAAMRSIARVSAAGASLAPSSERWSRKAAQTAADLAILEECIAQGALVVSGERFYVGALSLLGGHP